MNILLTIFDVKESDVIILVYEVHTDSVFDLQ